MVYATDSKKLISSRLVHYNTVKKVREDYVRKYLIVLLSIFVFGTPHIAVAADYDPGVKATVILKTTTTTGNYPVKYLNTDKPK